MSIIGTIPAPHLVGRGQPSGKVAASVGAVYTDIAATAGAIRWIKTSGAGAIGWRVLWGDTDWRAITNHTAPGITVTAGYVNARRAGDEVNLVVEGIKTDSSGNVTLFNLPSGLRPGKPVRFTTNPYWSTDTVENGRVTSSGAIEFRGLSAGHQFSFNLYYSTIDPWPAVRPGSPA